MINIVPVTDWIDHRHDEKCVCEPDILYDSWGNKLLMHYSCESHAKYMCNVYHNVLLHQSEVTRKE